MKETHDKRTETRARDLIRRQEEIDGADAIIARDTSGNNDVVKAMTAWKSYVEALPSAQLEVTEEAVKEYCRKRCLCIVDSALLKKYASAQPEDYTELKREFLRMASYIDVLLECSDKQKETLIGFVSRLAEFMPWTERD